MNTIQALNVLQQRIDGGILPESVSHAHIVHVKENDATEEIPSGVYLVAELRFMMRIDDQE
jgi:hypothetical protein